MLDVDMLNIVWKQCACYVWPLVVEDGMLRYGTCGYCGVAPDFPAAIPHNGRAHPLEDYAS